MRTRIGRSSNIGGFGILVGITLFIVTLMFEYSFQTIFGKDLPWFLDLLGGVILNGIILIVWFICLVCNYSGVPSPWW